MRKLLFIFISFSCTSGILAEQDIPGQLLNSTVILTDNYGHGSGVIFARDGVQFIWTAAHVANQFMRTDGTFNEVTVTQGNIQTKARVLRSGDPDVDTDCALLQIIESDSFNGTIETAGMLTKFYRAFNHIKVGQEVIHCGTPFGRINERLVTYGRISYVGRIFDVYPKIESAEVDNCDITAYSGCSGGPVVDLETGGIVGIVIIGSAPRLCVIEPTRKIYEWAKSHDCLWAFDHEVPLPEMPIVSWRSDKLTRVIENRYTGNIDARWGDPIVIDEEGEEGKEEKEKEEDPIEEIGIWMIFQNIFQSNLKLSLQSMPIIKRLEIPNPREVI